MLALKYANLGLRFVLELCALAALGYWGYHVGQGWTGWLAFGLGAPVLAAVLWGVFASPRAVYPLPHALQIGFEIAYFSIAIGALASTGRTQWAWVFAGVLAVNMLLVELWHQRGGGGSVS